MANKAVKFKFPQGAEVKDQVTGLVGVINCRAEWLNGCHRYSIQPKISDKEPNKLPDSYWVDGEQLELVKQKKVVVDKTKTGGPTTKSPRF
jgi:hypothetical protein